MLRQQISRLLIEDGVYKLEIFLFRVIVYTLQRNVPMTLRAILRELNQAIHYAFH